MALGHSMLLLLLYVWLHATNGSPATKLGRGRLANMVCAQDTTASKAGEMVFNGSCQQCGQHCCTKETRKRIIHGTNALSGEFPWHASIFDWDDANGWKLRCGGVLVAPQYVLTAAHCVWDACGESKRVSRRKVSIGEVDIALNSAGVRMDTGGLLDIKSIVCHPSYTQNNDSLNKYDVAVITLSQRSYQPTACLSNGEFIPIQNNHCFGIGHGKTNSAHTTGSSRLQKVRAKFIDINSCKAHFSKDLEDNLHTCTSTKFFDSLVGCNMDSGSPVVCPLNPEDPCSPYVVYGLFSNKLSGLPCQKNRVSVMTNMFSYRGYTPIIWASREIGFKPSEYCEDL